MRSDKIVLHFSWIDFVFLLGPRGLTLISSMLRVELHETGLELTQNELAELEGGGETETGRVNFSISSSIFAFVTAECFAQNFRRQTLLEHK